MVCQYLDWDSEFFGCRIARVLGDKLTAENVPEIPKWSHEHALDCLYLLIHASDLASIKLAEENHFSLVDIRLTLEIHLTSIPFLAGKSISNIRFAELSDISYLKEIASASHHDSRFYSDPNFPRSLCDALYATWIERSCRGFADNVFVAELENKPVGYISCHLKQDQNGQIGLVGVHPSWRGKSLGQELLGAALQWFSEQGVKHVSVVTQGRNAQAQRLYQRCGFLSQNVQLWYHRWFSRQ